jgi:drug/metabolite transporter (DMT)-like permease
VIAAALAIVILSQPMTRLQAAAIAVICGAVLIEAMWPQITTSGNGATRKA